MACDMSRQAGDYYEEIVLAVEGGEGVGSDIELNGREPSPPERLRAQQLVMFLEGILPRLGEPAVVAQGKLEIAITQAQLLDDPIAALEAAREAFKLQPKALHIVRGYRKAALRAESSHDLKIALRGEVRIASLAYYCAPLRVAMGRLLEGEEGGQEAALVAYQLALGDDPSCVEGLLALERIARDQEDWREAAEHAEHLAKVVEDPILRAELYTLAARHLERASEPTKGIMKATRAMIDAPDSPSASFVLERLACKGTTPSELIWLRRSQIDAGMVDPSMGWFDLGVVARYLDDLPELARQGFVSALDLTIPDSASRLVTLGELASVLRRDGEWAAFAGVEQERAMLETDLGARAAAWHRVGKARELHLDDDEGAIQAYEQSLREDERYVLSLDGLGRALRRSGRDRRFYELGARYAPTPVERALSLRRLGELQIQEENTLNAGITSLKEALELIPGDLTTLSFLEYGLVRREAWTELVEVYERQIEHSESDALLSLLLSRVSVVFAEKLDDRRRSIESLRRTADLGPKKVPETLARLAAVLQQEGEFVELVDVLERLAEHVDDLSVKTSLREQLASELYRRGHKADALKHYAEALELATLGHPFLISGVPAFLAAERWGDVAACFERCATSGEAAERALWLCRAAECHALHLGDDDRSLELLRAALELDEACLPALEALEEQLIVSGQWPELRKLLAARAATAPLLLRHAILSEAMGEIEDATASYEKARAAGSEFASLPLTRRLAADERWDDLASIYREGEHSGFSTLHALYRAAEVTAERLGQLESAGALFEELRQATPDTLAPMTILLGLEEDKDKRLVLLRDLSSATQDRNVQAACLSEASDLLEQLGHVDEALDVRRCLLSDQPSTPVAEVDVELALEGRHDRLGLVEILRDALGAPALAPELRSHLEAELGRHLAELGLLREASEMLKASIEHENGMTSLVSRITLTRLSKSLGDGTSYFESLNALASCLPPGPEQAMASRFGELGAESSTSSESVVEGLSAALESDPLNYAALKTLEASDGASEVVLDHLRRAFERETGAEKLVVIGATLCSRLLREDRLRLARWVLDRLLKIAPEDLRANMIAAEIHRRDEAWRKVVKALEIVATHQDAEHSVRIGALGSMAAIYGTRLGNRDGALKIIERLNQSSPRDRETLEVMLQAQEMVDNAPGSASCLVALTENDELEPGEKAAYLARLAWVQANKLNNESAALDTVSRIEGGLLRGKAACSFFELVEKSHRWDLVAEGLTYVVEHVELERSDEIETRARLAALLEGRLEQPDEALSHYQRIVELDPANTAARERIVELSPPEEPELAIEARRTLLEANPNRARSYRALRALALETDSEDLAFCAEAILEGMGWATDEETYFYQQRRTRQSSLLGCPPLDAESLYAICPEFDEPSIAVLRAIDDALAHVFPVDTGAYGVAPEGEGPVDREIQVVASAAAQVFGVPKITLELVSPRQVPTIELGNPRLLVLPRSIVDCTPREKSFICGALLSRAAIGGVLGDPGRKGWATDLQIEYALWAACEHVLAKEVAPFERTAVFADIKRRISKALDNDSSDQLAKAAERMIGGGPHPTGAELRAIMARASARAGMLSAVDPAMGVTCLRTWKEMFSTTTGTSEEISGPDPVMRSALSFAVSADHLRTRRRLGLEVR